MSPDLFQTIFNQHLRPNLDLSNYIEVDAQVDNLITTK